MDCNTIPCSSGALCSFTMTITATASPAAVDFTLAAESRRRHERASGFGYGTIADHLAEVTPRSLDTPKPSRDIGHGSHRCEAPLLAAREVGHCWTHGSLD